MNADEHRAVSIPAAWSALDLDPLSGVLLIVGAPDSGKSTFARWLCERLAHAGSSVAFLDGDIGQSTLGPPTTMTLALPARTAPQGFSALAHQAPRALITWFVGDVSPRGRMLPLVVGAGRLTRRALEAGVETVVVDTTGLVDPVHGGVALKHALVDQLQPTTLWALQRAGELESLLAPLRHLPRPRVVELPVSEAARRRNVEARRAHRAGAFRRYFTGSGTLRLSLRGRALFAGRTLAPRRLLALQDSAGFVLALGAIVDYDEARDELDVRTPLSETDAVASVHLGAIGVDADTGREFRPGRRA